MNDEQRQNLMRWRGALRHPSNRDRRTTEGLAAHDKVCAVGLLAEIMGVPKRAAADPSYDYPRMMDFGFRFPDSRSTNSYAPSKWWREVTGRPDDQNEIVGLNIDGFEEVAEMVDDWLIEDEIQRWSEQDYLGWIAERQDVLDG